MGRSFRKFRLVCEDVQGKNCLTSFHGMSLTTDKERSMVKKWQTLINGNVDVKTTDGFTIRVFCIGFTRKQEMSTKKTCYAQAQQIRNIRKKMIDVITREVSATDLKEGEGDQEAKVRPGEADGHARGGQWQGRHHHGPNYRGGRRENRRIRTSSPRSCLVVTFMEININHSKKK